MIIGLNPTGPVRRLTGIEDRGRGVKTNGRRDGKGMREGIRAEDNKLFLSINLSIYLSVCLSVCLSIYLKSQDYGDVSAGAQQGRLTIS